MFKFIKRQFNRLDRWMTEGARSIDGPRTNYRYLDWDKIDDFDKLKEVIKGLNSKVQIYKEHNLYQYTKEKK